VNEPHESAPDARPGREASAQVRLRLHRGFVFVLLFAAFGAAYLVCPYWRLPSAAAVRIVLAAATLGLGLAWAWLGCGRVEVRLRRGDLVWLLALGAVLLLVNCRPLTVDIPWRGDEDYHIQNVNRVAGFVTARGELAAVVLAVAAAGVLALAWRQAREVNLALAVICGAAGVAIIVGVSLAAPVVPGIQRHPFVSRLVSAVPVLLARPFVGETMPEMIYRLLPFLAAVLVAWYPTTKLPPAERCVRGLLALSVGTMPLVLNYTSILYLEMPAVFLMLVVCFGAEHLLTCRPGDLRRRPGWYALILLGFIKETVAPFLGAFVLVRLVMRMRRRGPGVARSTVFRRELGPAFCVLLPLGAYLFYRFAFRVKSGFEPSAANAFTPRLYGIVLRSLWEQCGLALPAAAGGLLLLAYHRRWAVLAFVCAALTFQVAFHLAAVDRGYAGYSRFNLLLVPGIVFAAWRLVARLLRGGRAWPLALLGGCLAANVSMAPINFDGTHRTGWGDSAISTTERYYPYRAAAAYINRHHRPEKVLHAGLVHSYYLRFYLAPEVRYRMLLHKRSHANESVRLREAIEAAQREGFDMILFQPDTWLLPPIDPGGGFEVERVFRNAENSLFLLVRRGDGAPS